MILILDILRYVSNRIRNEIEIEIGQDYMKLEEIRLRINCPIILKFNKNEKVLNTIIFQQDIKECIQYICENSIYAYQNEINQGFITIRGGHRVGITGECVIESNKVINISYIYSLNYRISKQIIGAANEILKYIINKNNNEVLSTLIISPPGAGKTTILRDLVRQLSQGIENLKFNGKNIGVVDERSEIAAMYKGIPQNDLGIRTDILNNIPKAIGIEMLIRSMSPDIIIADEIGNLDDVKAINYAMTCGIKGIFTAHGGSLNDINSKEYLNQLIKQNLVDSLIFLDKSNKGKIKEIYYLKNKKDLVLKGTSFEYYKEEVNKVC